jgi:hypothetical protein
LYSLSLVISDRGLGTYVKLIGRLGVFKIPILFVAD